MKTWDVPLRIVRARYKVLYVVAWGAVAVLVARWIYPLVSDVGGIIVGNLVFIGLAFVAVRSFRGKDEPIAPPRAAWRMTGTVRSAVVMAVVIFLITGLASIDLVSGAHPWTPTRIASVAVSNLEDLVLVALFINSAVRLHRSPDPLIPKPVVPADPVPGLD